MMTVYMIRLAQAFAGSTRSADNGTDWYNADSESWTCASDEATEFETREDAQDVIEGHELRGAIVAEYDE